MRLLALSAALTFALDQATKLGVIHGLNRPERGEIAVLPPYLVFHWAKNYGINFGFPDTVRLLIQIEAVRQ